MAAVSERVRERVEPVVRYEFGEPGGMLHLDTKQLGGIVGGPGHRATGDRRDRKRGVGWEIVHVALDDATRLVPPNCCPTRAQGCACGACSPTTAARTARRSCSASPGASRSAPAAPGRTGRRPTARSSPRSGPASRCEFFASSHERRIALERFYRRLQLPTPSPGIGGRTPQQRLSEKLAA